MAGWLAGMVGVWSEVGYGRREAGYIIICHNSMLGRSVIMLFFTV